MTTDLAKREHGGAIQSVADVRHQVNEIQLLMRDTMRAGEHYGTIPGCGPKPALLLPGAQKILLLFNFAPEFEIVKTELGNDHREYDVTCRLRHRPTGGFVGEGVGTCTTREKKYRYRSGYEPLDEPIPQDYKQKKAQYAKQGFGARKINDEWRWCKIAAGENPDIADTYNTVLKMAKKRALCDAVITATAASDIFNQDIEEIVVDPPHTDDVPVVEQQQPAQSAAQNLADRVTDQTFGSEGAAKFMKHIASVGVGFEEVIAAMREAGNDDIPDQVSDWPVRWRSNLSDIVQRLSEKEPAE